MTIKWMDVKPHPGGLVKITAVVDGDIQVIAKQASEAISKPHSLIIQAESKKRSLDANAYYWTLIGKLASALRTSKRDIHRLMLANYGETETNANGKPVLIRMAQDIDPAELGEIYVDPVDAYDGYVTYRVLKGSSKMDSKEFSALLDGLIGECKGMDIEVLSDDELQRLYKQIQESQGRNIRRDV